MNPNDTHDRESLSALHDGELAGEARLFALRRLSHDAGWKDDCGRWQLIGDAMRRQAPIAAPAGLAARVRDAVAAEASALAPVPTVATVATPTPRRPVRMWVGGALAASLALVAVVATRAPQPSPAPSAPAVAVMPAPAAAQPAVPTPIAPSAEIPAVASTTTPTADAIPASRQVAAVDRPQPRATAVRPARRTESVARDEVAAPSTVAAFTPPDVANPFHVSANDALASRPWPRASAGSNAALTASYGAVADALGDSPSFYPFEPRVHDETTGQANTP
ncbi:hypothetical protein DWG18_08435 [Lysobacter sp. TY2-98]|uniref:sigma-E factor negative regulatory protein n=1 Tax=Lysobacter sp. TY2-98 TaxID=2290922 RepID=UPI000E201845|nr:sigma-E factor negative regulatory protein [Lysobacter sp. TY2-98]AXK72307.1 hypothetical protein DWG18_08435 [Lysobacter sp. TY2-98]